MKYTDNYIRHPVESTVEVKELVSIHYFEYTKDYKYSGESHDFWEIMYLDRGRAYVTCDQVVHLVDQGKLILLPPNAFHTIEADTIHPSNVFIISFSAESAILPQIGAKVLMPSADEKKLIHFMIQEGELAFELPMPSRHCLNARQEAPLGSQQLIRIYLELLLIQLLRRNSEQNKRKGEDETFEKSRYDHQIAGKIMEILRAHVHDTISIEEITDQLGYGKTYLSAVFKKIYGVSIMTSFTALKIDEAKYLIREGAMSISEISDFLGFGSPQYFTKRFRQFVHMSPKQYENSVKTAWNTEPET